MRATRAGLFETVRLSSTCWVRSHSARGSPCLLDLSRVCQRGADARRRLTPCSAASPPRPPPPRRPGGLPHDTAQNRDAGMEPGIAEREARETRAEIFELAFRFQYPASHQFDTYTQQTTRQSGVFWTCCRASAFARRGRPMKRATEQVRAVPQANGAESAQLPMRIFGRQQRPHSGRCNFRLCRLDIRFTRHSPDRPRPPAPYPWHACRCPRTSCGRSPRPREASTRTRRSGRRHRP